MCDTDNRQAGAKIEVTPEMIAAGGQRIQDQCGPMPMTVASTIAHEVFLEMIQTKRPTGPPDRTVVKFMAESGYHDALICGPCLKRALAALEKDER